MPWSGSLSFRNIHQTSYTLFLLFHTWPGGIFTMPDEKESGRRYGEERWLQFALETPSVASYPSWRKVKFKVYNLCIFPSCNETLSKSIWCIWFYPVSIWFYPICIGGLTIQLALRIGLIIPCKKTKTLELYTTQLAWLHLCLMQCGHSPDASLKCE